MESSDKGFLARVSISIPFKSTAVTASMSLFTARGSSIALSASTSRAAMASGTPRGKDRLAPRAAKSPPHPGGQLPVGPLMKRGLGGGLQYSLSQLKHRSPSFANPDGLRMVSRTPLVPLNHFGGLVFRTIASQAIAAFPLGSGEPPRHRPPQTPR